MLLVNGVIMDTPFSRALVYLGVTQKELSERAGLLQPTVSRLVSGNLLMSRDMAARILDVLDPARATITELQLLYPLRYPDWRPGQNAVDGEASGGQAERAPEGA